MSLIRSKITIPAHTSYNITGDLSISAMVRLTRPASFLGSSLIAGGPGAGGTGASCVFDLWVVCNQGGVSGTDSIDLLSDSGGNIIASSVSSHPNDTWFQVGIVRDSVAKTVQCYRNGAVFSTAQSYSSNPTTQDGSLSVFSPTGVDIPTIKVAEIGIWNTKLTAANMLSLSNGSSPACIVAANLVEYIHLDPRKARLQLNMTGGNV